VFFDRSLSEEFDYRCKQAGQLASKMRFLAAQWVGMLESNAWLSRAAHANEMANILRQELASIQGVRVLYPVQANAVFAEMSPKRLESMRARGWDLYNFIGGGTRLMCSWNTTRTDIENLLKDLRDCPND
jgi:threonine aldolase